MGKLTRMIITGLLISAGAACCGCFPAEPGTTVTSTPASPGFFQLERLFPGLSFEDMTNFVQPDGDGSLVFVSGQRGLIHVFDIALAQPEPQIFLDITERVSRGGNEEGLLGLAFDPQYRNNGYFYVYYSASNPRRSVVSRFSLEPGSMETANPQSEIVILEIGQPYSNHNGGQIAFGPDGYLYIGVGDGGSGGDPQGNGQNSGTLLGSILRININGLSETGVYEIPADNPFVDTPGARAEIWAFGLRNPWRFSFDTETGLLWAGDVGQNRWEEIDIVTRGANYGWNIMEGSHCYSPAADCNQPDLELPVFEYDHSQGCSITGGYVYRGDQLPALLGYYIYGDYCSGNIWALDYEDNSTVQNMLLVESGLNITVFGEDREGNIYILSRQGGIYTLAPTG